MTTSIKTEQKPHSQKSLLVLDCLYCEEQEQECWEKYEENDDDHQTSNLSLKHDCYPPDEDDDDEIGFLLAKEKNTGHLWDSQSGLDAYWKSSMEARREAVEWMMRVMAHHNLSVITLVLGVNYFDRFMMSFGYQTDRPWMIQLAAVACLSLASKMEETHVPLLLDFQVKCKYIFEAKTIQRMELLVLSTLEWKMNAVTPMSYFAHLLKRLKLKTYMHWDILCSCQSLILSAILDPRFLCYVPSVLAIATTALTLKELRLWSTMEQQIHLIDTFTLSKDKVKECYNFIQGLTSNDKAETEKGVNSANSPKNVLDHAVSCESSKSALNSLPSSPGPPPAKRSRTLGSYCFR